MTKSKLLKCDKPQGKLERADYKPLIDRNWIWQGYYCNGKYYEKAIQYNSEGKIREIKWYILK